jgi:cytochrome c oxidase assembly protein subunit 11
MIQPDQSRLIRVNFLTNTNDGMPWEFWAETTTVRVHPGELKEVKFYVRNPTDQRMVGQAIPSVVPIKVTEHFHKTECFCFRNQVLEPGEVREMPMRFIVGPEVARNVQSISLSYALFDITNMAAGQSAAAVDTGAGE